MPYQKRNDSKKDQNRRRMTMEDVGNFSPDRPPIWNQENISSSEAGTSLNDPHLAIKGQGSSLEMSRQISNHLPAGHVPSTYASSSCGSIHTPDGLERKNPPYSQFLQVGHNEGLGEAEHRQRAMRDEMEIEINEQATVIWVSKLSTYGRPPFETILEDSPRQLLPLRLNQHMIFPSNSPPAATWGSPRSGRSSSSSPSWGTVGMYGSDFSVAEAGGWVDVEWQDYMPATYRPYLDEEDLK